MPASLVTALRVPICAGLVAVTVTPGNTPPWPSLISPLMLPVELAPPPCATAGDASATALLDQAALDLARLVDALDAATAATLPIVMRGSVGERLVARWPEALRARVVQPAGDSCDGALRLLQGTV